MAGAARPCIECNIHSPILRLRYLRQFYACCSKQAICIQCCCPLVGLGLGLDIGVEISGLGLSLGLAAMVLFTSLYAVM